MISDILLERYLSGDLPAEARARVDAALAAEPQVRARYDALVAERAAFYAADPPAAFAHRVATVVQVRKERAPAPWRKWLFSPVLALAAALVLVVGVLLTNKDTPSTQAKFEATKPEASAVEVAPTPAPAAPAAGTMDAQAKGQFAEPPSPRDDVPKTKDKADKAEAKRKAPSKKDMDDELADDAKPRSEPAKEPPRSAEKSLQGSGQGSSGKYAQPPPPVVTQTPPPTTQSPPEERAEAKPRAPAPKKSAEASAGDEGADVATGSPATAQPRTAPPPPAGGYAPSPVAMSAPTRGRSSEREKEEAPPKEVMNPHAFFVAKTANGQKRFDFSLGGTPVANVRDTLKVALFVPDGAYAVLAFEENGTMRVVTGVRNVGQGRIAFDLKKPERPTTYVILSGERGFSLPPLGTEEQRKRAFLASTGFSGTEMRIRVNPE